MVWTLTDSFSDPLLNIYYTYFSTKSLKKQNHFYFSIHLIISIIIVFCALIYNEFLILFCCELEHNTYSEIISRLYF